MQLTNNQQKGLDLALERHRAGCKYTIISGYASWIKLFWSN